MRSWKGRFDLKDLPLAFSSEKAKTYALPLEGACVVEFFTTRDTRGTFSKLADSELLNFLGFNLREVLLTSSKPNVLRGMHFQAQPMAQAKLVFCLEGKIFDAIVDLRPSSPTFGKWLGIELSPEKPLALYVPRGFAHGYYAFELSTVLYLADNVFSAEHDRALRWDDPAIGIDWPFKGQPILSQKDANALSFDEVSP